MIFFLFNLQPYSYTTNSRKEKIYNWRHSRARRISENVFGIMATRFRVLRKPILQSYQNGIKTVLACIALHNYMREREPTDDVSEEVRSHIYSKVLNLWWNSHDVKKNLHSQDCIQTDNQANDATPRTDGRASHDAESHRNLLADWFVGVGALPHQEEEALRTSDQRRQLNWLSIC